MWWHALQGLPGQQQDRTSTGASALYKSSGERLGRGGLWGADGKGMLCGALAARGHSQEGNVLSMPQFPSW